MKDKYRILEYRNHFTIQKKEEVTIDYFFWEKETFIWTTIKKDGNALLVRDWMSKDFFQFATKEEALQVIEDLEKYPIYHEVELDRPKFPERPHKNAMPWD